MLTATELKDKQKRHLEGEMKKELANIEVQLANMADKIISMITVDHLYDDNIKVLEKAGYSVNVTSCGYEIRW